MENGKRPRGKTEHGDFRKVKEKCLGSREERK